MESVVRKINTTEIAESAEMTKKERLNRNRITESIIGAAIVYIPEEDKWISYRIRRR